MNTTRKRTHVVLALVATVLVALLPRPAAATTRTAADNKMKPEELVTKHLDSIGTTEARAAARNRIVTGTSVLTLRLGGKGGVEGSALMASDAKKNMILLAFDSPDYPYEKMGYDGTKLTVRYVRPGFRTPLGEFLRSHDVLFREGLIGGALSESWPLLRVAERNPKMEYGGLKKIDGRQAHELKYTPRKGSDLKIKLYFEAETFRHIRSEYERVIAATMGQTSQQSVSQRETRFKVVEEFSNFKEESGLTLPHTYKFELQVQSQNTPLLLDWVLELTKFSFNQTMSDKEFEVESE